METAITRLLGIQYPIFQGGMAWVAEHSLASAVSNAGGLGIIAAANAPYEYVKEEMQNMFGGVCVKQFVLFFGERLQYYITEMEDEKEQLTESGTLSRNDTGREQRESKYSLLNDIAIGRNLHDYGTMENLLYEYFEKDYIVKEMFHMR